MTRSPVRTAVEDAVYAVVRDATQPLNVHTILYRAGLDYHRWYSTTYAYLRRLERLEIVRWQTGRLGAFFSRGPSFGYVALVDMPPVVVEEPKRP